MAFSGANRACILVACFLLFLEIAVANEFTVGGKSGWSVPTGSETQSYNDWAEKRRFHVGDTLLFKYTAKEDSVLQVTHEAFQKCNTTAPLASYDDGQTVFKFPSSGPFYFISGAEGRCDKGQKLVVVVMSQGGRRRNAGAPAASPALGSHAFAPLGTIPSEEGPAMAPGDAPAVAPTSGASSLASGVFLGFVALAASLVF
ncbi:hypothetical protein SUGI_0995700 [Cryptomeria japonica]|uniref:early nodulin-like protein 15 n=1 Tax=Cryptomeria japonica TaxID=3369 RepID=UPI002414B387|nr:early nodulin-like protein 15 [Cryptomeria japonica]GLJ47162.1 hypothetical protein SUGI_0995700 [Cryptomeria japonica]